VPHGTVTEKRIRDGKDVSGQSIYMDLLKKRSGKWMVVRGGGALLKSGTFEKSGNTPAGNSNDIEAVRKIGRDMGDAMVAVDIDRLSQIFADDWATVSDSGTLVGKEKLLQDIKSGDNRLVSYEMGPIDVNVLGDRAVAQGTVSEKRARSGRNVAAEGVYMDLLKKREGKWVVVRSAGAFLSSKD
jgi:ketosteroid isomerase-like protein